MARVDHSIDGFERRMQHVGRGRVLRTNPNGTIYICRCYSIYSSADGGQTWQHCVSLPCSPFRRLAGASRLLSRLLRLEVRAVGLLSTGGMVASTREGIYYSKSGERQMKRSRIDQRLQKVYPPMTLTVGPMDRVIWGEYRRSQRHGASIVIYVSDDGGESYNAAHTFAPNDVKHIHNVVYDPALQKYWVLAGDCGHEPGFGLLSDDLKDFDWVGRGAQVYRAVDFFDCGDHLVYGMDSNLEPNAVLSMDKATGRVTRLAEIEGSCIYACRCGPWYVLSSSVEPSDVNRSRDAALYVSRDGDNWRPIYRAKKDGWHDRYFQFGSIALPRGESPDETLLFSGQSLIGIDGQVFAADLSHMADST